MITAGGVERVSEKLNIQRDYQGLDLCIEYLKGDYKYDSQDPNNGWTLHADYGYIEDTLSNEEGEELDCFVGPDEESTRVFLISLMNPADGQEFMEYKVLLGFDTPQDAEVFIHLQYPEPMIGPTMEMTLDDLGEWVDQMQPLASRQAAHEEELEATSPHPDNENFDDLGENDEQEILDEIQGEDSDDPGFDSADVIGVEAADYGLGEEGENAEEEAVETPDEETTEDDPSDEELGIADITAPDDGSDLGPSDADLGIADLTQDPGDSEDDGADEDEIAGMMADAGFPFESDRQRAPGQILAVVLGE